MPDRPLQLQRIVVAAFLHNHGEVLLARRSALKRIAPGKYHLPGGHVEFVEHPADALARELREELGIAVSIGAPIWVFSYLWDEYHTVGIVYDVEMNSERSDIRYQVGDIDECVWITEAKLNDYLEPSDHNYQAARAGFERLRLDG
jgi:mutator protein MutT